MNDENRKKILARRAAFVAAALAGVGAASTDCTPRPCLEPPAVPDDADKRTAPEAGSPEGGVDPKTANVEPDGTPPQVCLSLVALEDGGLDAPPAGKHVHLKPRGLKHDGGAGPRPCLLADRVDEAVDPVRDPNRTRGSE